MLLQGRMIQQQSDRPRVAGFFLLSFIQGFRLAKPNTYASLPARINFPLSSLSFSRDSCSPGSLVGVEAGGDVGSAPLALRSTAPVAGLRRRAARGTTSTQPRSPRPPTMSALVRGVLPSQGSLLPRQTRMMQRRMRTEIACARRRL